MALSLSVRLPIERSYGCRASTPCRHSFAAQPRRSQDAAGPAQRRLHREQHSTLPHGSAACLTSHKLFSRSLGPRPASSHCEPGAAATKPWTPPCCGYCCPWWRARGPPPKPHAQPRAATPHAAGPRTPTARSHAHGRLAWWRAVQRWRPLPRNAWPPQGPAVAVAMQLPRTYACPRTTSPSARPGSSTSSSRRLLLSRVPLRQQPASLALRARSRKKRKRRRMCVVCETHVPTTSGPVLRVRLLANAPPKPTPGAGLWHHTRWARPGAWVLR